MDRWELKKIFRNVIGKVFQARKSLLSFCPSSSKSLIILWIWRNGGGGKEGGRRTKKEIFFPFIYFLFLPDTYVSVLNLGKLQLSKISRPLLIREAFPWIYHNGTSFQYLSLLRCSCVIYSHHPPLHLLCPCSFSSLDFKSVISEKNQFTLLQIFMWPSCFRHLQSSILIEHILLCANKPCIRKSNLKHNFGCT